MVTGKSIIAIGAVAAGTCDPETCAFAYKETSKYG